ncbi:MAG: ATP-binding protein [Lachnospiraceae bacterium]
MALKNAQYDVIMRAYEEKQLRSRDRQDRCYQQAYTTLPRLLEIDRSISRLSVEQGRKLLDGDKLALVSLKKDLLTLSEERTALLLSAGYPKDFLEPHFDCAHCQDTGYVNGEKCPCFKRAVIDLLYAQSNLKNILERENFDTFSLDYYSKNYIDKKTGRSSYDAAQAALLICHDFVDQFAQGSSNLFLYGDTGVGKTFLANSIAKSLMDASYSVIYFTAFELFDVFAKSKFEKDQAAAAMDSYIFDCDLLIIDDLGTELSNSFTTSQLFLCLNERLLREKATLISTNLALDALVDIYSERTFSRITSNYTMVKLTGDDIRIKKKLMK